MTPFTIDDLRRILRACAGEAEAVDLDDDIADVPLADLGYDSLALLELISHVEREYRTPIPDDAVVSMYTPRGAVSYINQRIAMAA